MSACIHRKRANLTTCIQCNCLFSNEQNRRSVIKRLDDAYTFLSRIYFIVMNGAVHDELNTRKLTIIHDVRRNLMRNVVINVIKKMKRPKAITFRILKMKLEKENSTVNLNQFNSEPKKMKFQISQYSR